MEKYGDVEKKGDDNHDIKLNIRNGIIFENLKQIYGYYILQFFIILQKTKA